MSANLLQPQMKSTIFRFLVMPSSREGGEYMKNVKVYVPLLEEGTPTLRGTQAVPLSNGLYKLLPTLNYDPEDEIWAFLPGSIVRCVPKKDRTGKYLEAVEKVG
jgi:hypothetical protein